jgi:hypothetical protein
MRAPLTGGPHLSVTEKKREGREERRFGAGRIFRHVGPSRSGWPILAGPIRFSFFYILFIFPFLFTVFFTTFES